MSCPNTNSKDWKMLTKQVGEKEAWRAFMAKDEMPKMLPEGMGEQINILYKQNPEYAKIGTEEEYAQFLMSVFPESKIKDIVFHGGPEGLTYIRTEHDDGTYGAYFGAWNHPEIRGVRVREKARGVQTYPVILNIKNPLYISVEESARINGEKLKTIREAGHDGVVSEDYVDKKLFRDDPGVSETGLLAREYVVFEQEKYHMLGTTEDMEMFRKRKKLTTQVGEKGAMPKVVPIQRIQSDIGFTPNPNDRQLTTMERSLEEFNQVNGTSHRILSTPDGTKLVLNYLPQSDMLKNMRANPRSDNHILSTESTYIDNVLSEKLNLNQKFYDKEENVGNYENIENELEEKIKSWFEKSGITYKEVPEVYTIQGLLAQAKADIYNKLVEVAEGKRDRKILPEEASHILVEMMGENHPLYKQMEENIEQFPEYQETKDRYGLVYNGDENLIRKEAIGKVMARLMTGETREEPRDTRTLFQRLIDRVLDWFRGKNKVRDTAEQLKPYKEAIKAITEGKDIDLLNPDLKYISPDLQMYHFEDLEETALSKDGEARMKEVGFTGTPTNHQKNFLNKITDATKSVKKTDVGFEQNGREVKAGVDDFVNAMQNKILGNQNVPVQDARQIRRTQAVVRKILEVLVDNRIKGKKQSPAQVMERVRELKSNNPASDFYGVSDDIFQIDKFVPQLDKGAEYIVSGIQKNQETINRETGEDGRAIILNNQLLYNEKDDLAGLADVVAVYSNGKIGLYNFSAMNIVTPVGKTIHDSVSDINRPMHNALLDKQKEILSDTGLNDFAETRIIPIQVETRKLGAMPTKVETVTEAFKKDKGKLKPIMLGRVTHHKKLQPVLNKLYEERDRLRRESKKKDKREALRRVNRSIDLIQAEADLSVLGGMITGLEKSIENSEQLPDDAPRAILEEDILDIKNYLEAVDGMITEIINAGLDTRQDYGGRLLLKIGSIRGKLNTRLKDLVNRHGDIDIDEHSKQQTWLQRMFKQFSDFTSPAMRSMFKIVSEGADYTRRMFNKDSEEILDRVDRLKKAARAKGSTLQKEYNKLIIIKKGKKMLVHKYSDEYEEARKKAAKRGDTAWFLENTNVTKKDGKLAYKDDSEFQKKKREEIEAIERRYPEDEMAEAREKAIARWRQKYDIGYSREALNNDVFIKPEGTSYFTKEYLELAAPGNEALFGFYNWLVGFNEKLSFMTGGAYGKYNLPAIKKDLIDMLGEDGMGLAMKNAWGIVKKALEVQQHDELYGTTNPDGTVTRSLPLYYVNDLTEKLSDNEEKNIRNEMLSEARRETEKLNEMLGRGEINRAEYTQRIKEFTEGNPQFEEKFKDRLDEAMLEKGQIHQTSDIGRALLLMTNMAHSYSFLLEREGFLKGIRSLLQERQMKTDQTDDKGNRVWNKVTKKAMEVTGTPVDDIDLFDQYMNNYIYGIRSTKPIFGKKTEKALRLIQRGIAVKALGLRPLIGFGNLVNIALNSVMVASGGQYYGLKDLRFGVTNFRTQTGRDRINFWQPYQYDVAYRTANKKAANLATRTLTYDNMLFTLRFGDENMSEVVGIAMMKSYGVNENGEIEHLRRIKERTGKDVKSIYDSQVFDKEKNEFRIEGISEEKIAEQYARFRAMMQKQITQVTGMVSQHDKMLFNRGIVGSLLGQFKSWIPAMARARGGQLRYDPLMDDFAAGRFRVFLGEIAAKGIMPGLRNAGSMLLQTLVPGTVGKLRVQGFKEASKHFYEKFMNENPEYRDKITLEQFENFRRGKIRESVAELRILMSALAVLKLMAAAVGDDEEKDALSALTNVTMLGMNRGFMELTFFVNPLNAVQVLSYPAPALSIVNDIYNIIDKSTKQAGDVITGEEDHPNETSLATYLLRFLPIPIKGIEEWTYPIGEVFGKK